MFNKLLITGVLTVFVAACATRVTSPRPSATAGAGAASRCVSDTGTRIPVSPGECAGFGRTYTQQDVFRTGAPTLGQALRTLDSSVSLSGR